MKRCLAVLLCIAMAFTMTGCAKETKTAEGIQETAAPAETTPESAQETEAPADTTQEPAQETEETKEAAPEEVYPASGSVVKEAAMAYFADFADDKNVIKAEDLFTKIDAGEDMLILDIRQADAYGEGHLKGAVNLPYGIAISDALENIPDDVPVYVNCYTGQTSSQTTALLRVAGKFAYNIQSGFDNGISKTEKYENYLETNANELPGDTYEVDADIKTAIANYYKQAATDTFKSFNFPVDSLKELVEAESEDYNILSVRQAEDYNAGHIQGAVNIPFAKGMQESFGQISTDKPVVVYCYTGQTASQVMAIMRLLGYEAYNLSGGMGVEGGQSGWLGAGLPVVTE